MKSGDKMSDKTRSSCSLQALLKHITCFIIDKVSLISKSFLVLLSRQISVAKESSGRGPSSGLFDSINIIICSDFHQLPPITVSLTKALSYPANLVHDSIDSQVGHSINKFKTAVILREQIRVTDSVWCNFLGHLCYGHVQECHL